MTGIVRFERMRKDIIRMAARTPFGFGEWYHCYNRGVDKRATFLDKYDYERFQELLYFANGDGTVRRSDLTFRHADIFETPRGDELVKIGAYCLMPNHFHLLIQEATEGGISLFMQRLGTSFAMYFNQRNERIGNLFVKPFRSKHVSDDRYFKRVAQYIHLNPAELYEPEWKEGKIKSMSALEMRLCGYTYSSLPDYQGVERPENTILDTETMRLIAEDSFSLRKVLNEAALYYKELGEGF